MSEMDLRYKYFAARVKMAVGEIAVVSPGGHVQLVDLALSFKGAEARLGRGEDASFGFTEKPEVIHFRTAGSTVHIESSEKPYRVDVETRALVSELAKFRKAVYDCITKAVPQIVANESIRQIHSTE
ncbi:hypothetical protein [Micromonospora sp. AKA38]|uniref:hypothetical protein n=1 Tax=Micromonospora sp. AKA38 TaxID=2733861 RepID=UPI002491FE52|nr:hypothetical protein [Micromonospora sp. AKA38]